MTVMLALLALLIEIPLHRLLRQVDRDHIHGVGPIRHHMRADKVFHADILQFFSVGSAHSITSVC